MTIGDKTGTFKDGKLTIDGEEYTPTVIPEAGARFTINEHKHSSFRGMCGLITGCTTSQEYLSLAPDGKFILTPQHGLDDGRPGPRAVDRRRQLPAGPAGHLRDPGGRQDPAGVRRRQRARGAVR